MSSSAYGNHFSVQCSLPEMKWPRGTTACVLDKTKLICFIYPKTIIVNMPLYQLPHKYGIKNNKIKK